MPNDTRRADSDVHTTGAIPYDDDEKKSDRGPNYLLALASL
jgi:hypothetical protein